MPVRVKQRSLENKDGKAHERLLATVNKELVGLLLAWGRPIDLSLRASGCIRKLYVRGKESLVYPEHGDLSSLPAFNLPLMRTILSQATYIDPSKWDNWVEISARTDLITIEGAVSLEPAPSKQVQFMSLGVRIIESSVGGNVLYDEINGLFAASRFGMQEDVLSIEKACSTEPDQRRKQDGFTNKQLKGGGKGVDRWPMFFIRINIHDDKASCSESTTDLLMKESALTIIVKVLVAMFTGFLEDHNFRTRQRPPRKCHQRNGEARSVVCVASPVAASPQSTHYINVEHSSCRSWSKNRAQHVIQLRNSKSSRPEPEVQKLRPSPSRNGFSHLNSLGDNVKIPKFQRSGARSLTDGFSSWSRIKSGNRIALHELTSQLSTCRSSRQTCTLDVALFNGRESHITPASSVAAHGFNGTDNGSDKASFEPTRIASGYVTAEVARKATAVRKATDDLAAAGRDTVALEETISWKNPISKATILLNARTGLAVVQPLKRPVSTLHSQPSHCQPSRSLMRSSESSLQSRTPSVLFASSREGSWVSRFLKSWDNPVFHRTEEAIPQVAFSSPSVEASMILHGRHHRCSHLDIQDAFTESSSSFSTNLSKDGLRTAYVISQVEKKFILVCMNTRVSEGTVFQDSSTEKQLLVLMDQHAADERIRVESLLAELCAPPLCRSASPNSRPDPQSPQSGIRTTILVKSISFDIPVQEHRLFANQRSHFANWGILYDIKPAQQSSLISGSSACRLIVKTLPEAIAERCRLDPNILTELMRNDVWKREESTHIDRSIDRTVSTISGHYASSSKESWLSRIHDCPQGIIDIVNSRSCRSAIMFNDELTIDECQSLLQRLAESAFPFQCAHGRPSMIPLVDLAASTADLDARSTAFGSRRAAAPKSETEIEFTQAWTRWRHYPDS